MKLLNIGINTFLSSAMVTSSPEVSISQMHTSAEQIASKSNVIELPNDFFGQSSGCMTSTVAAVSYQRWDAQANVRFKHLARAEAKGEISVPELAELESLTILRREAKYPRSADEILWQRRQQKLSSKLVEALHAYIDFHESENYPEA